jgi:drug/metabolite transporter (DMT)-like permease
MPLDTSISMQTPALADSNWAPRVIASGERRQTSAILIWLALIVVSVLWGTEGVATRAALRGGVAPYTLSALRMAMASVVLLAYLVATRKRVRISRHLLGDGAVMALTQVVVPSALFAAALEHLPSGTVSLLYTLVPVATVLWTRLLLHAGSPGTGGALGLAISIVGAVLVVLAPATAGNSGSILGFGLVIVAVAVASFAGVYAKRHASHPLLEMMAPEIMIGAMVLLAPGLLHRGMNWGDLSLGTWAVVGYLAVGVTVVSTALLFWLVKRTSALRVSLVNYMFPLVAVVLGALWFGEELTGQLVLGGFILLLGVAIVGAVADGAPTHHAQLRPCPDIGGIPIALDCHPCGPARAATTWSSPRSATTVPEVTYEHTSAAYIASVGDLSA